MKFSFIILGPFGLGAAEVMILFFVLLLMLVPMIFYLLTLQRTMEMVAPELRKMSPGQVWLLLIPVFGIIWNFMMVGYIADSLAAEFQRRNLPVDNPRPGYPQGFPMAILQVCSIIPFIGGLAGLAGLVMWIIYWVKISGYKTQLELSASFPGMHQQHYRSY